MENLLKHPEDARRASPGLGGARQVPHDLEGEPDLPESAERQRGADVGPPSGDIVSSLYIYAIHIVVYVASLKEQCIHYAYINIVIPKQNK